MVLRTALQSQLDGFKHSLLVVMSKRKVFDHLPVARVRLIK